MDRQVLLVIVDGLSWPVIQHAMQERRLPTFSTLAERGIMRRCVSIFPSITPAATASIVTGVGPLHHKIQGAFWYDPRIGDIEYYGSSPLVALREGLGDYFDDFLLTLNDELLESPTLFEFAAEKSLRSASINLMWRRGRTQHPVEAPWLVKLIPGVELAEEVQGPEYLFQGDFISTPLPGAEEAAPHGGPLNRFGFNDQSTTNRLESLFTSNAAPAMTAAYFPDNDFDSHERGAERALATVERVDTTLARLAEVQGGWSAWLEKTSIIIVGDHGHSALVDEAQRRGVPLEVLLADWSFPAAGMDWRDQDELMVCPNMRAACVAWRPSRNVDFEAVIGSLLEDSRIDQAIWRDPVQNRLHIRTAERGELIFTDNEAVLPATNRINCEDANRRRWSLSGSLEAVDARIEHVDDGPDRIVYGDYPDALRRIAEGSPALATSDCPTLWVTAKPGYEFTLPGTKLHTASAHGALHRSDSDSVLIAAGAGLEGTPLPEEVSITDVTPLCFGVLQQDTAQATPV